VAGVAYQGALEQVMRDGHGALTLGATWVTGEFFPLLGVGPVLGRTLVARDDLPGAEPVMVISHSLWQRYFGGSPGAVGSALEWNGELVRIVGVLPRGFEYPAGAEVWMPVLPFFPRTLEAQASPSEVMVFDLVARLAAGASVARVREEFGGFLAAAGAERPAVMRELAPHVVPLAEHISGDARGRLWAGAAAVLILLLIACVNVANLLLIRGSSRLTELAVRSALGAGRRRLMRQLLTETSLLAAVGGVIGVLLAWAGVRVLVAIAPPELPRREMIELNGGVLLFAVAATAAAALLAGLLPSLITAAGDLGGWLRGGARAGGAGHGGRRLRHGLVIGQISLAIVVVFAAGLLVRSVLLLQNVDLGFAGERLLVAQLSAPADVAERAGLVELQEEAVARVAAIPGVAGAAALPRPPFSARGGWSATYTGEGQASDAQAANPLVNFEVVGPQYFRTLAVPLLAGRAFDEEDREDAPPVAVISESLARHTWPGEEALGRRIKLGPVEGPGAWHSVVGVVGETRYRDLTAPQPTLYLPIRQFGGPVPMSMAVRTSGDPASLVPLLRSELQSVHPELMLVSAAPLAELMGAPLARPRFSAVLIGTLAGVTLFLAIVGIYGAMAANVRQRTRELGIRMALGASVSEVKRSVLRQGVLLAVWGVLLGGGVAILAGRALRGMLFGVGPADASTFAAVVGLVIVAASLACYLPARGVARISPARAVQAD
jgi:putative ABC transport system permease protein